MMKATFTGDTDTRKPLASAVGAPVHAPSRLADYLELTKPRIAVMALFTVGAGYLLGAAGSADWRILLHTLVGAGLVAAGGSALNQLFERKIDARMRRTMKRPLPAGRVSPEEAAAFGAGLAGAGLAYLAATVSAAATVAAALTFVAYAFVYTPLKTKTAWNTAVGAVPGALPPVIGWCAACGWSGWQGAAAVFAILFLWQIPHFLAIAWMYRADYAAGSLKMLPGCDPRGTRTAFVMVATAAALLPLGGLVPLAGLGGWLFAVGATLLSLMFLRRAVEFARDRTDRRARKVLHASLFHLPGVFALLMVDALLITGCASERVPTSAPTAEPDLEYPVGAFRLTERSGATVTDQDLRGQVWVGSFIFTRCNGPCPAVTATMGALQRDLADELKSGKLKLVTFTVDPTRDDLKSLNEYADARRADPKNWLFLTGPEKTIHTLLQDQFKQAVGRKLGPDVREGDEFGHSTRLMLVDKTGVIRAMYDGLPNDDFPDGDERFAAGQKRLKDRVRELLR